MLKNKLLIRLTALGLSANAQWNGTNPITTSSNVGIGTTTPTTILHVSKFKPNSTDGLVKFTSIGDQYGTTGPILTLEAIDPSNSYGTSGYQGHYGKGILYIKPAQATWNDGTNWRSDSKAFNVADQFVIENRGFVGIGTASPSTKLTVWASSGSDNISQRASVLKFDQKTQLYLASYSNVEDNGRFEVFGSYTTNAIPNADNSTIATRLLSIQAKNKAVQIGANDAITINASGQIGVGTATPNGNYKLDIIGGNLHVDGRIDTKDVCVTPSGFCDFVFDENYNLIDLDSLKGYIKKNKHLPHFPSEKQIVKYGMSITDITLSQTRTIEELVLYTLKQQEIIKKLEERIEAIETTKNNK